MYLGTTTNRTGPALDAIMASVRNFQGDESPVFEQYVGAVKSTARSRCAVWRLQIVASCTHIQGPLHRRHAGSECLRLQVTVILGTAESLHH